MARAAAGVLIDLADTLGTDGMRKKLAAALGSAVTPNRRPHRRRRYSLPLVLMPAITRCSVRSISGEILTEIALDWNLYGPYT